MPLPHAVITHDSTATTTSEFNQHNLTLPANMSSWYAVFGYRSGVKISTDATGSMHAAEHWISFDDKQFLGLFSGAIYGAMVLSKQFSGAIESTKDGLKKRGLDITENGLSVKTEKRLERDDYIDGTGRNLVDALKVASFGSPENQRAAVPDTIGQGYAPPGTRHRASLSKKH
ncbi:hypothetical protein RHS02_06219, partial [Rhizoctonia solani]